MINLDQVRTLEWKVKQAVQLIVHLRRENDTLRGRLSDTEVRLQELESLLESFKATQNEMETGIRSALEELDHLETEEVAPHSPPGPVESVGYPPVKQDEVAVEVTAEAAPADSDAAFEEEFAALAAAEAAALVDETPEPVEESVPESIELEEHFEDAQEATTEELALSEPEVEETTPVEPSSKEEREPEQPGLGIF